MRAKDARKTCLMKIYETSFFARGQRAFKLCPQVKQRERKGREREREKEKREREKKKEIENDREERDGKRKNMEKYASANIEERV